MGRGHPLPADVLFDPAVDSAETEPTIMRPCPENTLNVPRRQNPIRIGVQFDHGKTQRLRGGFDGLLVFRPEPGGLVNAGPLGVP